MIPSIPLTARDHFEFQDRISQRRALKAMRRSISKKANDSKEHASQDAGDSINLTCIGNQRSVSPHEEKSKTKSLVVTASRKKEFGPVSGPHLKK